MRRLSLFVCGIALPGAVPFSAQNRILPKQFRNWTVTKCIEQPPRFILATEAGERGFEVCSYSSGDKSIGIRLGLYRDPSSAYEIFTSRLSPGMVPTNLGQVSAFDEDDVIILEGSLVLWSTANVSKDDLGALVKSVEPSSQEAPLPPIR